jgi:hypothetical protein
MSLKKQQIIITFLILTPTDSPGIIWQIKSRRMRWVGHVAHTGKGRNMYRDLVGNPEGKRPLERPRRR